VGAAAEAIGEILRRDARSERRSSEEEKAEEGFNGISLQGRAAGVAGEAGKAARFMMPPSRVASSRGGAAPASVRSVWEARAAAAAAAAAVARHGGRMGGGAASEAWMGHG
jgi:hypothetical protein